MLIMQSEYRSSLPLIFIQTERTNQQKVHKLLELLPHRGPEAFDKFVSIIELKYPWLAKSLENGLSQERQKYQENRWSSRIDQLPRLSLERLGRSGVKLQPIPLYFLQILWTCYVNLLK